MSFFTLSSDERLLFTPVSITPLIDTEDACFDLNASRPIAKGDLKWRDALLVAHRVNSNKMKGNRMDQTFEKRKKVIYDFICDDFSCPNESQRDCDSSSGIERTEKRELQEVLDALVEEGKIYTF